MPVNRICRLIGHKPDRWACRYWDSWRCSRCRELFYRDFTPVESWWVRWWTFRIWIDGRGWAFRNFLRCSMCGRRFGRHGEDCLPF